MLKALVRFQTRISTRDRGATAVEYGLMVTLIAIAIIGSVTLLGGSLKNLFNSVAANL